MYRLIELKCIFNDNIYCDDFCIGSKCQYHPKFRTTDCTEQEQLNLFMEIDNAKSKKTEKSKD